VQLTNAIDLLLEDNWILRAGIEPVTTAIQHDLIIVSEDRDLLLVELLTESTSRAYGQTLDDARARAQSVREARSRFHVAPQDFQVILVGKDGTAKRRESNPIQPEVIFNEIDATPMRQREMREQSRG